MKKALWMLALAIVAGAAASGADAQDTSGAAEAREAPPVQTVAMRGVRDPAMMPYERAFDLLSRIRNVGEGRLSLRIRIVSAQSLQPIPDLDLSLHGDDTFEKLVVSQDGFITVPLREEYLKDNADFVTNQKKGRILVEYFLVPILPADTLRFRDIAASIAAARKARAEIVPWYMRLFIPAIKEVRMCYPDDAQKIRLVHGDSEARAARLEQKNMLNRETVYCAAVDEKEAARRPDTIVAMEPGWIALFN